MFETSGVKRVMFACLVGVVASSAACRGSTNITVKQEPPECTSSEDCPAGAVCSDAGECRVGCDATALEDTCPDGQACSPAGQCVDTALECSNSSDCDSPPDDDPFCDADTSVTPASSGVCLDRGEEMPRSCEYTARRRPCLKGCDASTGLCLDDQDACLLVSCDEPPGASCQDSTTLIRYARTGECEAGECSYEPMESECARGCMNGACVDGPCEDANCDDETPPEPTCDGDFAVSYGGQTMCEEQGDQANCIFEETRTDCAAFGATCSMGMCEGGSPQSGEVIFTEVMVSAGGGAGAESQWVELYNTTDAEIDLEGWSLSFGARDHTIANGAPLTIPVGGYVLLGASADPLLDGVTAPAYVFGDVVLGQSGALTLAKPGGESVDIVTWADGAIFEGSSRHLGDGAVLTALANDDVSVWCSNLTDDYGSSRFGTPAAMNPACDADPCAVYTCGGIAPAARCNADGDAETFPDPEQCSVTAQGNPSCSFVPMVQTCDPMTTMCMDGVCVPSMSTPPLPGVGEVIITEVMADPLGDDASGEWIEVYNTTARELTLTGLELGTTDPGATSPSYEITEADLTIAANAYVVFAVNTDSMSNGGITAAALGGGLLENSPPVDMMSGESTAQLTLSLPDATLIDTAYYAVPVEGASQQLSLSAYDGVAMPAGANDGASNHCAGQADYDAAFGKGTPGAANVACP